MTPATHTGSDGLSQAFLGGPRGVRGANGMIIRPAEPRPEHLPRSARDTVDWIALDANNPTVVRALQRKNLLAQTSASAGNTAERCTTRWWLGDVAGLRMSADWTGTDLESPAEAGTVMHTQHENWRLGRVPHRELHPSLVMAVQLGHIPTPTPVDEQGWHLEWEFWAPIPGTQVITPDPTDQHPDAYVHPVTMHGFVDLLFTLGGKIAVIKDFKTKGSPEAIRSKRYGALTPKELSQDGQIMTYAAAVWHRFPTVEVVSASHVYLSRNPHAPAYVEVQTVLRRDTDGLRVRKALADRVNALTETWRRYPNVSVVPRNLKACWDFGGCDFLRVCDVPVEDDVGDAEVQDVGAALAASLHQPPGATDMPSPLANAPFPGINPPDGYPPGQFPPSPPTKKDREMNFTALLAGAAQGQPPQQPQQAQQWGPPGPPQNWGPQAQQPGPPQQWGPPGPPPGPPQQAQQWGPPPGPPPPPPGPPAGQPQQLWSTTAGGPVPAQGGHPGFSNPNPAQIQAPPPVQARAPIGPPATANNAPAMAQTDVVILSGETARRFLAFMGTFKG